jgi:SAM-dependent methyltransferase
MSLFSARLVAIFGVCLLAGNVAVALPEAMQALQCQYCKEALTCSVNSKAARDELIREGVAYETDKRFQMKIREANMPLGQIKDLRYHSILGYLKKNVMVKGQSVLDLGCAAGAILKLMGKMYDKFFGGHSHFGGIELTPGWVKFAKEDQPQHQWFNADATEFIPEMNKTFDVIVMNDSMEHIVPSRYGCLFDALFRYSKPGTVVYMHVPTSATQLRDKGQFFENVVPQNILLTGMACAGFELEAFEYDMGLNCGSHPVQNGLHYTSAQCKFHLDYPKYYHVVFRRPANQAIVDLLPNCNTKIAGL